MPAGLFCVGTVRLQLPHTHITHADVVVYTVRSHHPLPPFRDKTTTLYLVCAYRHIMLYRISSATRAVASAAARSADVHIFSPFPLARVHGLPRRSAHSPPSEVCVPVAHNTGHTVPVSSVGGARGTVRGAVGWTTPREAAFRTYFRIPM